MTLGMLFKDQFKPGDAIYGFAFPRSQYLSQLPKDYIERLRAEGNYLYCDDYNNRTFASNPNAPEDRQLGLQKPRTKSIITTNYNYHREAPYLTEQQRHALQEYAKALEGSRYSALKAVEMKKEELLAKGNRDTADLVFRRACKFGLQYFIEQMQSTVHFVLDMPKDWKVPGDRISDLEVVQKERRDNYVTITYSELRKCFRHRDTWVPQGRLKFYFELKEVNPPWVDHPHVWAIYEEHRNEKKRQQEQLELIEVRHQQRSRPVFGVPPVLPVLGDNDETPTTPTITRRRR